MATGDLSTPLDLTMLVAQALGTEDLTVANEFDGDTPLNGELHDYDALALARFALMRPDEREVFCLLAEGTSVVELAGILGIEETVAEVYRATVYRKMDIATILDLALLATILRVNQSSDSHLTKTPNACAA